MKFTSCIKIVSDGENLLEENHHDIRSSRVGVSDTNVG